MALRPAVIAVALFAAGAAQARDFEVRTAGAATALAVDRDSVRRTGRFRTGWAYEFYRERNPLAGRRTQITGILWLVDCGALASRRLKVVHYLGDGRVLSRIGPERGWTEDLRGSNTDLMLQALCRPDRAWARRRAETVFELYRRVWR